MSSMKKIVIIGANDFQNPLILRAKHMGYETHVFAWQDGSIGETTADFFYPISIVEKEKILEQCKTIQPDAVATIASDLATITVSFLASALGLPCNDERTVALSTNKYEMRKTFASAQIPTPKFAVIDQNSSLDALADMSYPLIAKPTDRSGSRGITKITSPDQAQQAVSTALEQSFERKAIVEEFIDGDEYSCECISYAGQHHFLALTQKFTTGAPHFIETGHIQPANLSILQQQQVVDMVYAALDALGVTNGASHAEFKINQDGEVRLIEVGARMGGDCIGSDLVPLSTGYDFVKMVIDTAAGNQPSFESISKPKVAVIQFIFDQSNVDRLSKIRKTAPDALHFVSEIDTQFDHQIVDSSTRYGFYILTCSDRAQADWLMNL